MVWDIFRTGHGADFSWVAALRGVTVKADGRISRRNASQVRFSLTPATSLLSVSDLSVMQQVLRENVSFDILPLIDAHQ